MTLEQYFQKIVNKQPEKETIMNFSNISMFFTQQIEKINSLLTKPPTFTGNHVLTDYEDCEDGYWAFEMYTPEWVDSSGETIKPVHTCFITPHEGTWFEVLDTILDGMEKHYGYNIKEQVYYSVNFPLNDTDHEGKPFPGYGRCLNDERLQQILLAFPELYLSAGWGDNTKREAMFK